MGHPVVHFEIRSPDPDVTRSFYGKLFGWTYPDGGIPGYTYIDPGVEGAVPGGISPLQGGAALVTSSWVSRTWLPHWRRQRPTGGVSSSQPQQRRA